MQTISKKQEWLILAATILASGMAFLDGSVVNIAIPSIQNNFHANFESMLWVVNAFPLFLASLLLISGALSDRFGRKKIFVLGIILFTLASLLCALSKNVGGLSVFRALQGIGAAMMIPGSLTIINLSFPSERRGQAIGLWSGLAGGVAAVGPFVGGWLVEHYTWRAIFYINLPLGILALLLTWYAVSESKNPDAKKLDWWGTASIFIGLFGLAYGLITSTWISVIVGVLSIIIFVLIERQTQEPLVPISIFKSKLVVGANLTTLFLYGALNTLIFFVVLNMQQVQDFSPIKAGLSLLPPILIITFLSGYGGKLADKIGPRIPMIVGPLLVSAGMIWMIFPSIKTNYFTMFMPGLILFGLGMALVIAPLTKTALAVPENFSGAASGVNNAVARVAGLLAVTILGAMAISLFTSNLQYRINNTSLSNDQKQVIVSQANKLGGVNIPSEFDSQSYFVAHESIQLSFVYAFRVVIGITATLALLSGFLSYIFIRQENKL